MTHSLSFVLNSMDHELGWKMTLVCQIPLFQLFLQFQSLFSCSKLFNLWPLQQYLFHKYFSDSGSDLCFTGFNFSQFISYIEYHISYFDFMFDKIATIYTKEKHYASIVNQCSSNYSYLSNRLNPNINSNVPKIILLAIKVEVWHSDLSSPWQLFWWRIWNLKAVQQWR